MKATSVARALLDEAIEPDYPEFDNESAFQIASWFFVLCVLGVFLYFLIQHYYLSAGIVPNEYLLSVILSDEYTGLTKVNAILTAIQLSAMMALAISSGYGFAIEVSTALRTQIYCSECGKNVGSSEGYCGDCGANLEDSAVVENGLVSRISRKGRLDR